MGRTRNGESDRSICIQAGAIVYNEQEGQRVRRPWRLRSPFLSRETRATTTVQQRWLEGSYCRGQIWLSVLIKDCVNESRYMTYSR